jgi:hypothetical protein
MMAAMTVPEPISVAYLPHDAAGRAVPWFVAWIEPAWQWWTGSACTRLASAATEPRIVIVISTRFHERDIVGRLITKQAEDEALNLEHYDRWRVLNIPAQADHDPDKGETHYRRYCPPHAAMATETYRRYLPDFQVTTD